MFDFIKETLKTVGAIAGVAVGSVAGLSAVVISETLGLSLEVVKEALKAGCTTYEEIKDFSKKGF